MRVRKEGMSWEIIGIIDTLNINPAKTRMVSKEAAAEIEVGLPLVYSRKLCGLIDIRSFRLFWRRRIPETTPAPRNTNGTWVLAESSIAEPEPGAIPGRTS